MTERMYPAATPEIATRRRQLAPEINAAFENFNRAVFAEGALPEKTKQLIAVAVAHVTQCPTQPGPLIEPPVVAASTYHLHHVQPWRATPSATSHARRSLGRSLGQPPLAFNWSLQYTSPDGH
jgi:hypothetical protein